MGVYRWELRLEPYLQSASALANDRRITSKCSELLVDDDYYDQPLCPYTLNYIYPRSDLWVNIFT